MPVQLVELRPFSEAELIFDQQETKDKDQSLDDVKIYERVRDQLSRNFRSPFHIILQARAGEGWLVPLAAFIDYAPPGSARA